MRKISLILNALLSVFAISSTAVAQETESAYSFTLDSVTVKGYRYRSPIRAEIDGLTKWNVSDLNLLPQVLGNAEPMRYAQMLPGIQTNNELRSGINIEGCDSQHNLISIEGVPVYNVNHLFGFFSTFNTTHFSSVSIAKGPLGGYSPNRIGGQLDMQHFKTIADTASGLLSVGFISSQGTVRMPVGKKTALTVSFRDSYLNLLYGRWLEIDGERIKYSFYDANLTIQHNVNKHNTILFDFYSGNDKGDFGEQFFMNDLRARWGNCYGAIHWLCSNGNGLTIKSTAYMTDYKNKFNADLLDMELGLYSNITSVGLKSSVARAGLNAGVETIWHIIVPQTIEHSGGFNTANTETDRERSVESSVYVDYNFEITDRFKVASGLRGSVFFRGNRSFTALDPSVRLLYDNSTLQISATYALRHQYLFQTGFSDAGLPTEFWISAGEDIKPQYAHELNIGGGRFFFNSQYKIEADLFYRKLFQQVAYGKSIFDIINSAYDIGGALLHGNGENCGFSLMLNKCAGQLNGWISYTYTRARRSFDEENRKKSYSASHERPHELNAVVSYSVGRHWSFGGTLVYASGTPLTPIEYVYLLNNNIVVKYGDYNSSRLRPYMRLDLSVNYKWMGKSKNEQGVNFSLYNATNRENELFRYMRMRKGNTSFYYTSRGFVRFALPSVSYYCKF